jgi:hypothetical protein
VTQRDTPGYQNTLRSASSSKQCRNTL